MSENYVSDAELSVCLLLLSFSIGWPSPDILLVILLTTFTIPKHEQHGKLFAPTVYVASAFEVQFVAQVSVALIMDD